MSTSSDDSALAAWDLDEAGFPERGTPAEQLAYLARYAVLAPNSHNTQPWLFVLRRDSLEIRADRRRRLPVVDPDDRALTISCGAAIGVLETAANHFGYAAVLDAATTRSEPDLLAVVRLEALAECQGDAAAFSAITRRRTNRADYKPQSLAASLVATMVSEAEAAGAWFEPVSDEQRATVADLIAEGDRSQWADPAFRREIGAWVRPNATARRDGMRGYAFGFGNTLSRLGPFVMRSFNLGKAQSKTDRRRAMEAALLASIGTKTDQVTDWLAAGRALARILLTATAASVSAAFMNQPIEVAPLRPRLAAALDHTGKPQLLLRFGYAASVPLPEPRRPIAEVLSVAEAAMA